MKSHLFFLSLLFSTGVAMSSTEPTRPTEKAQLKLTVENLKSSQGQIAIAIYSSSDPDAFPRKGEKAFRKETVPVQLEGQKQSLLIKDLPPGEYAIALFHDEDSDNQVKTGLFGIPKEGVGFSNNPTLLLGPPGFQKCRFQISEGENEMTIRLVHF